MKTVVLVATLGILTVGPGPAFALGEYNAVIEQACTGHSVETVVPKDILDGEKTIAMHPDPRLGRRITFMSGQRWICKMHKGEMLFGSTVDGWAGDYRMLPEINEDGIVVILSPRTSPSPQN
ncbi:MAG: hypothetical protein HQL37_04570 [Alphaproteobacteria bacterium]|nr:hypothetical protein [Alphaproteobacteria bacterium]